MKALTVVSAAAASAAATAPSASAEAYKLPVEARAGGITVIRPGLGTFACTAPAHAPCRRGRRRQKPSSSSGGDDGGDGGFGGGGDNNNGGNWSGDGFGWGGNEFSSDASAFFDALSLLALSGSLSHVVVRALLANLDLPRSFVHDAHASHSFTASRNSCRSESPRRPVRQTDSSCSLGAQTKALSGSDAPSPKFASCSLSNGERPSPSSSERREVVTSDEEAN